MGRRGYKATPPIHRVLTKILPRTSTGCWEWTGAGRGSYGHVLVSKDYPTQRGTFDKVHRVTYEHFRGPIPEGYDIDHLCRNQTCCNPWHLEAVTRQENLRRSRAIYMRAGFCRRGHPQTPDSVYVDKRTGQRYCRPCKTTKAYASNKARRQRLKAAPLEAKLPD